MSVQLLRKGIELLRQGPVELRKVQTSTKSIIHIQNRPIIRQRITQTGIGCTNMKEKVEMITQMMIGQNSHRCRKTQQTIVVIESQPGQKMKPRNTMLHHHNPNIKTNKQKECNRYRYSLNNRLQLKYRSKEGEETNHQTKMTLLKRKYYRKVLLHYRQKRRK
ncbi:MAG: hypothetical protein EZS28_004707 [Streblomastix strix]|uniref:Uncharacterized protein n=1 Tax=Streblomastix strix TaxID=222440 RepID=A0A5J4WXF3_9EUKA|nr:MAG: hypothetical protein EZS28_004707 [Streblomastix strix]